MNDSLVARVGLDLVSGAAGAGRKHQVPVHAVLPARLALPPILGRDHRGVDQLRQLGQEIRAEDHKFVPSFGIHEVVEEVEDGGEVPRRVDHHELEEALRVVVLVDLEDVLDVVDAVHVQRGREAGHVEHDHALVHVVTELLRSIFIPHIKNLLTHNVEVQKLTTTGRGNCHDQLIEVMQILMDMMYVKRI